MIATEKCNSYCEVKDRYGASTGRCNGTKERDTCSCQGEKAFCSFYDYVRKGQCPHYEHGYSPVSEEFHICHKKKLGQFCDCEGDMTLCPIAECEEATLNTAEMWLAAQEDGAYYECVNGDIAYSKKLGLVDKDHNMQWKLGSWDDEKRPFDALMADCQWRAVSEPITLEEAEKLLRRRIMV